MRITDVSAYPLSSPIEPPQTRRFLGGSRRLLKRDVVLVVVETADGNRGFAPAGASSSAMREYFEDVSHAAFATLLEEDVAPYVEGTEFTDVASLHQAIERVELPAFLEAQTIAPLDIAFYDLRGKAHGVSVCELLSDTPSSDRLPLYASAGMYMEPAGYAEQAKALLEQGFQGYKYRPGLGPEEDLRTLQAIRESIGDSMDIMIDAHTWWKLGSHSYDFDTIVELVHQLAEFNPMWLEEPVEPSDYTAYRRLADATTVPLAGGESEETPEGLVALGDTGGVSFLQGDVRHHRGFTGCWEVIEYCDGQDVTFVPHNFGTHLGLIANAQLIAAAPEANLLEYPMFGDDVAAMYPFPLAEEILETDLSIHNGYLTIPEGPGLGVEVNMDVIDEFPYIEGPWTEFDYDDSS